MKTKKIKCTIRYLDLKNDFALIWQLISNYLESYDYFVDKIIWVFEIEEGDVSIFPGSPEDANDPDIPLAFQFRIHDLWDGEPDEISEDDKAFIKAYEKRKKWLTKEIKQSFAKFAGRKELVGQGIDGKLGIYLAEFFERLMPQALTFVCGTKIEYDVDLLGDFCKKYDMSQERTFPTTVRSKRDAIVLCSGSMGRKSFVADLIGLVSQVPDRQKIFLSPFHESKLPEATRKTIADSTGIKIKCMTKSEYFKYGDILAANS